MRGCEHCMWGAGWGGRGQEALKRMLFVLHSQASGLLGLHGDPCKQKLHR